MTGMRTTITCKSISARYEKEYVVLEIEDMKPATFAPQLRTKAEAAKLLSIRREQVEVLVSLGVLPVVHVDNRVWFREADVMWLRVLKSNR